ncbi:MAG: hypothetical protein FJX72_16375 [Armatimonadetes bacterium]|nr:hypothetical protein [Armatimonadota bacterium]
MRTNMTLSLTAMIAPPIILLGSVLAGASGERFRQETPHVPVVLTDEAGNPIDPHAADPRPYSPRQTCGGCHPYDKITQTYHFTMGADVMSDDWGAKHRNRPWMSSPGQNGGQQHMSYNWLPKKVNARADAVGLTPYAFFSKCGGCHPGGSIFEKDRDGHRYDVRQKAEPQPAASLDGDYHKADWVRSGVLEADCMMCHMPKYDRKGRAEQLGKLNYRWAATVGAGLAAVEGAVAEGQTPRLAYKPGAMRNGQIRIIPARSSDESCLLCHAEAETKKRGHVWDGRNEDVHAEMACGTCHTTQDHHILEGNSNAVFVNADRKGLKLSCEGCHSARRMGAAKPVHKSIPASHLKTMACVVCHVRDANVTAVHTVDTTTGKSVGVLTNPSAKKYGESMAWQPALFRLKNGKISIGNALLPSWWGSRVGNVIHPLTFAETGRAYETVKGQIKDDNGDGRPEVNTESEIRAMLDAIGRTMAGGRLAKLSPAYVKGHEVWEMRNGRLVHGPHPQASPLRWTFSHNVSRASRALGAGGCTDCHGKPGGVFGTEVTVDPYGPDGKPVTAPAWRYLKLKSPDPYPTQ